MSFYFKNKSRSRRLVLPEEQGPGPLDVLLAVALDAGLEDEGVDVEVVVRGDGAVLTAAAGVLHHHRHGQGDTAEVIWKTKLKIRHKRCEMHNFCSDAHDYAAQRIKELFLHNRVLSENEMKWGEIGFLFSENTLNLMLMPENDAALCLGRWAPFNVAASHCV